MAIVADLEMPAKQWTMTLQLETLALSEKVDENKHEWQTQKTTKHYTDRLKEKYI